MRATTRTTAVPLPTLGHRDILKVLYGVILCIFLAAIDQTVVVPAVPAIAAELNGFAHLSWIVTAYLLTSTAATPIYGRLSDGFGRRRMLLPSLALFAVASAGCALAQTLPELILARAIQGLGGGGLMALSQAVIADIISPRERGRYQGYMAGAWGVASVAGPLLGGYLTEHLSWHWIFWINLPVAALAFVLCDRSLRMLPVRGARVRIDWAGAGLLTGAITAVLLLMSWGGQEYAWLSLPILALAAAGLVLLAALFWWEGRVAEPLLPPRLLRNGVVSLGIVLGSLCSLTVFGATFLLPLQFQLLGGLNPGASGALLVPFLGATTVGAFTSGQIARKIGRVRPILVGGLILAALAFVGLAVWGTVLPAGGIAGLELALGLGIGATLPSTLVMVQNAADPRDVGAATGCLLLLRSMGGAVGSTLVGALLAGRFADAVGRLGLGGALKLSDLRGHGAGLAPGVRDALGAAMAGGFAIGFAALGCVMVLGLLIALRVRDLPLRTASGLAEQAAGAAH